MKVGDLFVRFGADTTDFNKGSAEIKKDLNILNTQFFDNQKKLRELNTEYRSAANALKTLEAEIKKEGTATKEQNEAKERLNKQMSQLKTQIGAYKTEQQELRGKISASTKELNEQNKEMKYSASHADVATKSFGNLTTALKLLLASAAGRKLSEMLIGGNAEIEQYSTAFETLLGGAQEAQTLMKDVVQLTAKTPLQLETTASTVQLLKGFGVVTDELIEKTRTLGDVTQGNAEKLTRISTAYGKVVATGRLQAEQTNQFAEAGIPIYTELASVMNTTVEGVRSQMASGKVGIEQLDQALENLTTGNGQFAGMMEKQSQTFNGLLSTIKDNLAQIGRETGEDVFAEVKDGMQEFLDMINQARADGTLEDITETIGTGIGNTAKVLAASIKLFWEYKDAIVAITAGTIAYKKALLVTQTIEKYITAMKAAKAATEATTASTAVLNGVISASPMGLIVGIAAALTAALGTQLAIGALTASDEIKELNEKTAKLKQTFEDIQAGGINGSVDGMIELTLASEKLIPKIEELSNKTDKTAQDMAMLEDYTKQVNDILGNEAISFDIATGAIEMNTEEIYKNIEALKERALIDATKELAAESQKQQVEVEIEISSKSDRLEELYEEMDKIQREGMAYLQENGTYDMRNQGEIADVDAEIREIEKAIPKLKEINQELSEETQRYYDAVGDILEENISKTSGVVENQAKTAEEINQILADSYGNAENITQDHVIALRETYESGAINRKQYIEALASSLNLIATEETETIDNVGITLEELKVLRANDLISLDAYIKALHSMTDESKNLTKEESDKLWDEIMGAEQQRANQQRKSYSSALKSQKNYQNESKNELKDWITEEKELYQERYDSQLEMLNDYYDEREEQIERDFKNEEKRINKLKDAIDAEIEARNKLKEAQAVQSELDELNARLKYDRLDDFSRKEIEARIAKIKEEQADKAWIEEKEAEKEKLQLQLDNAKAIAEQRKEDLKAEQEEIKRTLEKQKEAIADVFKYISTNFESLAEFQQLGITDLNQLFVLATLNEQEKINNTFSIIKTGTMDVATTYSTQVNKSISETFDVCVQRAKEAIAQINSAIDSARSAASSLQQQASYTTNNNSIAINNQSLSASQIAKKVVNLIGG